MATGMIVTETLRGAIETTEGAATTPTRLLYIPKGGGITVRQAVETLRDERAWNKGDSLADVYPGMQDVVVRISNVRCSFEDAGWWWTAFAASGGVAGSVLDTTAYTRTWTPHQTDHTVGANGVRSLHLQFSTSDLISTVGWSIPGLVGEELELILKKRASGTDTGVTMNATFRTASAATQITAFTGSLSDRAQTMALGQQLKSYVDTSTIGTTADPSITEATFRLSRPAAFHDGMDNTGVHTSMHRPQGWSASLTFLRKFSDKTEVDAYLGSSFTKTLRKVRIIAEGAVVGATTARNTIRLDFVGKHVEQGEFGGEYVDGIWYQRFGLEGVYDSALTASWQLYTINTVSTAYTSA
jgi:hypothetical protein